MVLAYDDAGVHVQVASSAKEAIRYLRGPWEGLDFDNAELPDVIVLDISMPGVGGLGFLAWYQTQPKLARVPVVVFTSSGGQELERWAMELGAREFMIKPTDFALLLPVVERVLDQWVAGQAETA